MKSSKRELIMVVDDSKPIRSVLKRTLESAGYRTVEYEDLTNFAEEVKKLVPHLIVLDLILPSGSGFEFLDQRRNDSELKNIPVIVLSGLNDKQSVYRAVSLGANDYATKPTHSEILKAKVWKALQDRRFLSRTFQPKDQPKARVETLARIVMANQSGFFLEGPVKLSPGAELQITSAFLHRIGWDHCKFMKKTALVKSGASGMHVNHITAEGLSDKNIKDMKEALGSAK